MTRTGAGLRSGLWLGLQYQLYPSACPFKKDTERGFRAGGTLYARGAAISNTCCCQTKHVWFCQQSVLSSARAFQLLSSSFQRSRGGGRRKYHALYLWQLSHGNTLRQVTNLVTVTAAVLESITGDRTSVFERARLNRTPALKGQDVTAWS